MGAWPPCSTPELKLGPVAEREPPGPGQPLRLLFMGRIMTYKALPLFLDTVDILRSKCIAVEGDPAG